jgi:hypothetical protein
MLAEKPKKGKAKPVESSDDFVGSPFQSRKHRDENVWGSKVTPEWCEIVTDTSNETRVLAQIAYTFREGGSRLYKVEVDGHVYRVTYQRNKKLAAELRNMTEKQVKHAVQALLRRGILVEVDWNGNHRLMRISAGRVAELVAEREGTKK